MRLRSGEREFSMPQHGVQVSIPNGDANVYTSLKTNS